MSSNVFISALNLLLAIFFILLGTVTLLLPWAVDFRVAFVDFLTSSTWTLLVIALGSFALAALLFRAVLYHGTRTYNLRTGARAVGIDVAVIKQTIQPYWKELFGSQDINSNVEIKKNKIHVTARLPYFPFEEQRELLRRIETDLVHRLSDILDYRDELRLTVSFEEKR